MRDIARRKRSTGLVFVTTSQPGEKCHCPEAQAMTQEQALLQIDDICLVEPIIAQAAFHFGHFEHPDM